MTDVQWLCIHSFLITCSGIFVGKETHCCLFVEALRWMARMNERPLVPSAGRVR